jgi:small subunit ribosomal protein S35
MTDHDSEYAQEYKPRTVSQVLRFRYTTYMGESHPAEKKVVVEFKSRELKQAMIFEERKATTTGHDMSESEVKALKEKAERYRIKLIKLVGVRYNPDTDTIRISSERFEHAAQNKRYLGDLIAKLIAEARNEEDTFEDVPLDFRHHKPKKTKPHFPEKWLLTSERVQQLQELRQPVIEAPVDLPQIEEEQDEGALRIAEYVAAMPLGRRNEPGARP